MRIYFLCLAIMAMALGMKAQTKPQSAKQTTENWYGLIPFIDGFTDEIIVHINTGNSTPSVTVDFPIKNIGSIWRHEPLTNLEASKVKMDKTALSFMLPETRVDFEGNFQQEKISGLLYIFGRPYPITLTKDRKSVTNPTYIEPIPGLSDADYSPDIAMKRTIATPNTLFIEELPPIPLPVD